MAYRVLLLSHSWLRWEILILLIAGLLKSGWAWRSRALFSPMDRLLQILLTGIVDLQILIGLILYYVSPFTPKSGEQFHSAMLLPSVRFYAVEHQFTMIVALVAIHVASVLSRRAPDPVQKHRRWAIGIGIALVLILAGIPWPGLPYGRTLFRM